VGFGNVVDELVRQIPFTPNKLITVMATKKIVTHTVGLISRAPSQKPMVIDAAMISRGRETSHSRA
jgi:hypothetical protein